MDCKSCATQWLMGHAAAVAAAAAEVTNEDHEDNEIMRPQLNQSDSM